MPEPINKEQFLQLIQDNKGIIWKICNSYCRQPHLREDLAQEIIYQLWKSAHKFNKAYKFSTWMYRVALNVAISYYHRELKLNPIVSLEENHLQVPENAGTLSTEHNRAAQLQQYINELKELDRALIILYLEERPYAEIAEILGITETNVATKISRIRERLRQKFENNQQ
jgi:RNA polymerase sigma factor (sigma-70 family)